MKKIVQHNKKFLDVGCKIGSSFNVAKNRYGYSLFDGCGIDINKAHIEQFKALGYHGMLANAENLPFEDKSFELVIFNHVIEHMRDYKCGIKALNECLRVSSKTVMVGLPFFDEDVYLNSLGFKTYYSDWSGHTNMVHLKKLIEVISKNYKYEVSMLKQLFDSSADEIVPLSAPKNSKHYDEKLHGPKEIVKFDRNIWREYEIVIHK